MSVGMVQPDNKDMIIEELRADVESISRLADDYKNCCYRYRSVLEGVNEYINSLWGERVQSTQLSRVHLAIGRALRGDDWQAALEGGEAEA